jgi:hypothetical protein
MPVATPITPISTFAHKPPVAQASPRRQAEPDPMPMVTKASGLERAIRGRDQTL